MKNAAVFSALGAGTFTIPQREFLRRNLSIRFIPCLKPLSREHFVRLARPFQVIGITRRTLKDFGPPIIDRLPFLESVAIYAAGFEWVDAAYLGERGIRLSYLPDYCTATVAEHAMGCLLALSRRIPLSYDRARKRVPPSVSLRGWELRGKTLGVVGFGRIGRRAAALARAFGMGVIWTDPRPNKAPGRLGLTRLLGESDAVLLCASSRRGAGPLLGKKELGRLQRGAVIVNVSRASLVDHRALIPLLRRRSVAGYAVDDDLDILEKAAGVEPGRILQTAHTAWYSDEAIKRGTQGWVENLVALGRGRGRNLVP